jgi:hypothetical protein
MISERTMWAPGAVPGSRDFEPNTDDQVRQLPPRGGFLAWATSFETLLAALIGALVTFLVLRLSGIVTTTVTISLAWLERSWLLWITVIAFTGLALLLIIWPIRKFQRAGQRRRIEQIDSFYRPEVIAEYFNRFWAGRDSFDKAVAAFKAAKTVGERNVAAAELKGQFKSVLNDMFGLERIRGATLFMAVVAAIVLFVAFEGGVMWAVESGPARDSAHYLFGVKPDAASIAAIFGAYTWVASDVIYRYRQADISPSDINWYTLRFIVAIR